MAPWETGRRTVATMTARNYPNGSVLESRSPSLVIPMKRSPGINVSGSTEKSSSSSGTAPWSSPLGQSPLLCSERSRGGRRPVTGFAKHPECRVSVGTGSLRVACQKHRGYAGKMADLDGAVSMPLQPLAR